MEIKQKVDIPIIGVGGIMNWKDVVEYMIAGASAVQLGTINFINPSISNEILNDLEDFCKKQEIEKISQLTGSFIL